MNRAGTALMVLGALMLLFYPTLWVYGKVSQLYLHHEWQQRLAASPASHSASGVVGRLLIPTIFVDQMVVEGVDESQLALGPGHFPGTSAPGVGNCAVVGHLNVNGSPFRDLNRLEPGDLVLFQTDSHLVHYTVATSRVVSPKDTDLLEQNGKPRLTLITCMPGARMRYVVICKQTLIE